MLQLLPQLEKRKVFEPALLEQFKRYAQTENLKRKALDAKSLREYWDKLPAEDRKDGRIAAAAAQSFIALGGCDEAHGIVEQSLEANWDSALVPLYVECLPRDARRHLERAESWLQQHPGDPALLLALGQLVHAAGAVGQGAQLSRGKPGGGAQPYRLCGVRKAARAHR